MLASGGLAAGVQIIVVVCVEHIQNYLFGYCGVIVLSHLSGCQIDNVFFCSKQVFSSVRGGRK